MKDKLIIMWMKELLSALMQYSRIFLEELKKNKKNAVRITGSKIKH
jgi:hypothetical protein